MAYCIVLGWTKSSFECFNILWKNLNELFGQSNIQSDRYSTVPMVYCMLCVWQVISVVSDSATPWIVAHQALLSVGFSKKDSREIFVVPLRKEHLIRSSQQLALLATESVGIFPRLGPATGQWVRRPQFEWSDKEK